MPIVIAGTRTPPAHRFARAVTRAGFRRSRNVWWLADRIAPRPANPVVPLVGPIALPLPHSDLVADDIYRGYYERGYVEYLCALVDPGDVTVDVGANIGAYTLALAHLVGPGGKVMAFEPVPSLGRAILDAASDNRLANVELVQAAAGSSAGVAELFCDDARNQGLGSLVRHSDGQRSIEVEVTTLDDAVDGRATFVKIDVEGYEEEVLRGAARVLSSPALRAFQIEFLADDRAIRSSLSATLRSLAPDWMLYQPTWHKLTIRSIPVLRPIGWGDLPGIDYNCNLLVVRPSAAQRITHLLAPERFRAGIA